MYEARLDFLSPTGIKFAEVVDYTAAESTVLVNKPGAMSVQLPTDHRVFQHLQERSQIELWIRDVEVGLEWTRFFGGLYLAELDEYSSQSTAVISAMSYMWLLRTRFNAYPTGLVGYSKFSNMPAESIMKAIFRNNFIPSNASVLHGRLRDSTEWPAGVILEEADEGRGNIVTSWYAAQADLIDNFNELSKIGGGDFDIVREGSRLIFKFFPGQLGHDRRSTISFSLQRGNMGAARFTKNRIAEATIAIVGGQGDDLTRDFAVVEADGLGPLDYVEQFVPATHVEAGNIRGLEVAGAKRLADTRRTRKFEFSIIQTPSSRYLLHYNMGDLVSAINPADNMSYSHKIIKANVKLAAGQAPLIDVFAESTNDTL